MWGITWKGMWSHKRRLLGTTMAVVLGVAFLTASLTIGSTMTAGFDNLFREANAGTADLVVSRNTTSVPAFASRNRLSKPAVIVLPMVRDAVRTATPIATAIVVPTSRRLWLQIAIPGHATHVRLRTPSSGRAPCRWSDPIESTMRPSARNTTRSANAAATGSWVTMTTVWPKSVDGGAHEPEDLGAGATVEVAGRLVGEDHLRPAGQRPGHGDALLLPARQLARAVLEPVARARRCDDRADPLLVGLRAGEVHRQRDVLRAVSVGTRLNDWKTKPIRSRRSLVSCRRPSSARGRRRR